MGVSVAYIQKLNVLIIDKCTREVSSNKLASSQVQTGNQLTMYHDVCQTASVDVGIGKVQLNNVFETA